MEQGLLKPELGYYTLAGHTNNPRDLVQEALEQLIEMNLDNPFDGYRGEDWG